MLGKKYRCIESFYIFMYDNNGNLTENTMDVIPLTNWEVISVYKYGLEDTDLLLTLQHVNGTKWIEVEYGNLNAHFVEIVGDTGNEY